MAEKERVPMIVVIGSGSMLMVTAAGTAVRYQ
jgi:hypothetical protein